MRRVYSTLRPPLDHKSYLEWITKCNQKLSVSSRGLIAFTSSFCLNQTRPNSTSYHVYLCDFNTPYQPYLLVDSEYEFTIVDWDSSGTKLLVCDIRGCITIYTSKDYLISDWKPYFQQTFAAETFLTATWFHPGIVTSINVANHNLKSPANHLEYSDKIQQSKFGASLRLFGGKSAEGCLLVSSTGLICCLTLIADGSVDVATESLGPFRGRIRVVDICHHKDGFFVIGASSGHINATVLFYQVELVSRNVTLEEVDSPIGSSTGKRVSISCRQFYSFHLNIMAQMLNERENTTTFERVSHIKFITKDCPDSVLVEASGQNLSLIELWELEPKKKSPIHSAILDHIMQQQSTTGADDLKPNVSKISLPKEENGSTSCQNSINITGSRGADEKEWSFKGNYITDKDLINIQTPRFKMFGTNRQLDIILLAYKDSSVYCIRKEDLQPVHEPICLAEAMSMPQDNRLDSDTSPYKMRNTNGSINGHMNNSSNNANIGPGFRSKPKSDKLLKPCHITDMKLSSNQTVFVAIDSNSQIHTVKLPSLLTCQDIKDEETYLQYIFEYCLITGNDWWDALVCVDKSESIERICDKFYDAYERQPKHIQKKYYIRQLMIRASLYRCLNTPSGVCRASDCHTMIMLNSIGSTFKSFLRSQEQDSPAQNLMEFLKTHATQTNYLNCNDVISKLNERDFQIETYLSQCLQPLSQWVVDLAIFLVVSTPQRVNLGHSLPGAGLAKNKEALETIRELLIIIKMWGSQNEASLPVVHTLNSQNDIIGAIFRLISLMYVALVSSSSVNMNGAASIQTSEEMLSIESNQMANNISIAKFEFSLHPIGFISHLYHQNLSQQHIVSQQPKERELVMEYFREPSLPEPASCPQVEGAINMSGNRKVDIVRNISLGAFPIANLRHCTRCRSVSLIKPSFNTARAWEQRWISSCVCGGSWAQPGGSTASKLAWLHHQNFTLPQTNINPHAHHPIIGPVHWV